MSPGRVVWLTARREIMTRARSKVYRIGTVLFVVLIVAATVIIDLAGAGGPDRVGLTSRDAALAAPLRDTARTLDHDVELVTVPDRAAGEQRVRDGSLKALVGTTPDGLSAVVEDDLPDDLRATLASVARQRELEAQISSLGGDPSAIGRELADVTVTVQALDPAEPHTGERLAVGIIVAMLVYLALLVYGQTVSQGVVEEKTSRVVELLLSTIRSWQLMAGKVLGIGATALIQLVLVLAAGVAAALATGVFTMPASIALEAVVWAVVWFLLGFFMYALLFAATGALVSRQEDVGAVTTPLTIAIVLPFVLAVSILPADPGSELIRALSVVPLFAPLIMPTRMALGGVPALEVVLAVVLSLALIAMLVWLAGRIYANAVMRMGARVGLRDALRGS